MSIQNFNYLSKNNTRKMTTILLVLTAGNLSNVIEKHKFVILIAMFNQFNKIKNQVQSVNKSGTIKSKPHVESESHQ